MIGRRVIRVIRGRRRRLAVINIRWWIPPSWLLKTPKGPTPQRSASLLSVCFTLFSASNSNE